MLIITEAWTLINKIIYEMMIRFFSHSSYVMLWPEFTNTNTGYMYSQTSLNQPFKTSSLPDYF